MRKLSSVLDCIFDSLLYILLSYLLDSAALSFQHSGIFILFFAAKFVILGKYLEAQRNHTSRKLLPYLLLALCLALKAALMYFCGYLKMTIMPFS